MAKCRKCGRHGLFMKVTADGLCQQCAELVELSKRQAEQRRIEEEAKKQAIKDAQAERKQISDKKRKDRMPEYKRMVAAMEAFPVAVSADGVPRQSLSVLEEIKYSTITKKTPRDGLGNFVSVDVETTGLDAETDEIIDVAAIRFRGFEPVSKFTTLLKPDKPIPVEATEVNRITNEMVEGKPAFRQIAESLADFIGDDALVGHNLEFDLGFLFVHGLDIGNGKRRYYDTLRIAQNTVKRAGDSNPAGIKNHKLGTLCRWYGIPNPVSHRAANDALAVGLLLKELADERQ